MTRITAVVLTTAVLLFAACGADDASEGSSSKEEFVRAYEAACERFEQEAINPLFGQIFSDDEPDMEAAARVHDDIVGAISSLLDEREALRPPVSDQDLIASINRTEREGFEVFVDRFGVAVDARDGDALFAAFAAADQIFSDSEQALRDYGIHACVEAEDEDDGDEATTTPSVEAPPGSPEVIVDQLSFQPATVQVHAGDTVVWHFQDPTGNHDVAFGDVVSPTIHDGSWAYRFDQPGRYEYLCTLHPFMTGTIEVA